MKYDIDSIELDVHLTKDKKLVVFHDFTLERMCNINEYIAELTYNEIKNIKLAIFRKKHCGKILDMIKW